MQRAEKVQRGDLDAGAGVERVVGEERGADRPEPRHGAHVAVGDQRARLAVAEIGEEEHAQGHQDAHEHVAQRRVVEVRQRGRQRVAHQQRAADQHHGQREAEPAERLAHAVEGEHDVAGVEGHGRGLERWAGARKGPPDGWTKRCRGVRSAGMSRAVDLESDPSCAGRPSVLYIDSHIARPGERGNRRRRRSNRPGNSQAKGPAGATALRRATPRARAGPPKEQAAGPRRFRGETLRSSTEGA